MNKKYISVLYVLGTFLMCSLYPNVTQAANHLKFNHLTVVDGLLHNNTTCVAQDSLGFIWIGTQRGLNRYDGYKIDSYYKKGDLLTSVYSNRISKIVTSGNFLWLATEQGLECFDIRKKEYVDYTDVNKLGIGNLKVIQNLHIDANNRLWIGVQGKLLCVTIKVKNNQVYLYNINIDNKPFLETHKNQTPEIAELSNSKIILQLNDKLFELSTVNSKNIKTINISNPIIDLKSIFAIDNELWLFSSGKATATSYTNGELNKTDEIFFPDSHIIGVASNADFIWLSTSQGLLQVERAKTTNRIQYHHHSFFDPNSVISDHQSGVLIDKNSNLWVTTWGAGLSYANIAKQKFELVKYMPIKNNKYLPSEFVYSIHEDNKGHIYVGTKFGGISRYDLETKTFDFTINIEEKLGIKAVVPCIESDNEWIYAIITSQASSVYRINKATQKIELLKSYYPHTAFSFGFDNHNQLWVGVLGKGLSCLKIVNGRIVDEKLFTQQSTQSFKLSSNDVNFVFNDKQKNEVLISTTNGLNRLMLDEKGSVSGIAYYFADKNNPKTLSSNYLWPIDKENDSTYWIGTLGSGLNRIQIGKREQGIVQYTAESFGVNNGAPSNDIESVLVDKYGKVWCGGRYLSSFDYKTKQFKTYYEEDGLQSYLFATGTSCKTRSGLLFFGGLKGMNYFMPDTITRKQKLDVKFSRLYIDGKVLTVGDTLNKKIVLNYDLQFQPKIKIPFPCNNLKIEFSSLTYAQKKSILYRYKLEGYDKEWIYTNGLSPFATYSNLPYKNYKFILNVGSDNEWNETYNEFYLTMLPPWWQSTLAYFSYVLLSILIIVLIARYSYNLINLRRQMSLQNEREKQKEELMELKMNFFTNISHEFKTPLTLINATVAEIEAKNEQPLDSRNFRILKRNNLKLLHLISELMDFQRTNASLVELQTRHIDVCEFFKEIADEFIPLSKRSDIDLKLTLPENPIFAWVDEECLTKIVSNVISNSLRYTEKGGSVDISLTIGHLETYKPKFESKLELFDDMHPGQQLIFSISDTGIGISSHSLPDIFERFHTIVSRTSKHLGSGVGLALVRSLVKIHKGGVLISSKRNVGTEFVFSIPLDSTYLMEQKVTIESDFDRKYYLADYKQHLQDEDIAFEAAYDESKPTILFVDDNKDILMVLSEFFKSNYNILLANDGEEALQICNEKFPEIVVSDIMMPKMNGLELCAHIKTQLNTCFIPFILLTARGTVEQQIEGLEDGADAYIPKPFHLGLLATTISNLLKKSKLTHQKTESTQSENVVFTRNTLLDKEKQQFIDKLTSIVKNNYHNPNYSIDDICREIGISRSRLYVQMKSVTSVTLGVFIREYRLQKAAELLLTTNLKVNEVAYHVGIESPSFFTRSFKERFGVSPSDYVESILNK